MRILLVGLGGTAGALLRYAAVRLFGVGAVPWSTFAVNITGSFLLGLLLSVSWARLSDDVRVGLAVGVLGAFTTFSTLTAETLALVRGGQVTRAAVYAAGSVVVGLAAVALGDLAGRALGAR